MRLLPAVLLIFALSAPPLFAAHPLTPPSFVEGVHYFALPQSVPVELDQKIEVTEVFWYGCSYCFRFEPVVVAWREAMAEDVHFNYVPAMWNTEMEAHARLYYTAQRLDILEQAHQAIYNAIHIDGERLNTPEQVGTFLAEFGVSEEEVVATFTSPEATAFLKAADTKVRAYQIRGTPELIVDGRFRVQANQDLPRSQMFKVVDYLLEKIRAEQAASTEQPSNDKALL